MSETTRTDVQILAEKALAKLDGGRRWITGGYAVPVGGTVCYCAIGAALSALGVSDTTLMEQTEGNPNQMGLPEDARELAHAYVRCLDGVIHVYEDDESPMVISAVADWNDNVTWESVEAAIHAVSQGAC